jgi:hypothetical protein
VVPCALLTHDFKEKSNLEWNYGISILIVLFLLRKERKYEKKLKWGERVKE